MPDSSKNGEGKKTYRGCAQDGALPPAPRLQKPQSAPQQTPSPKPSSPSK